MLSQNITATSSKTINDRQAILKVILEVLSDGRPRKAKDICRALGERGLAISKEQVNSVLHREGRAQLHYNCDTYEHWLPQSHRMFMQSSGCEPAVHSKNGNGASVETLTALTVDDGLQFKYRVASLKTDAFISIEPQGSSIDIAINRDHPSYNYLSKIFLADADELERDELVDNFVGTRDGLIQLLSAWAKYEATQPAGILQDRAQNARHDWGRIARNLARSE